MGILSWEFCHVRGRGVRLICDYTYIYCKNSRWYDRT